MTLVAPAVTLIKAPTPTPPLANPGVAFFVRTAAYGSGAGSDWDNAAAMTDIPALCAQALPGAQIYMRAEEGVYMIDTTAKTVVIPNGGTPSSPITITGVDRDLNPMNARITGTRVPWSTTNYAAGTPENGYDVFRIADGAVGLSISFFDFTNVQRGVLFLGSADTISITDIDASNVYMLLDAERDISGNLVTADRYTVSNLTCARLTATGCEMGLVNSMAKMPGLRMTTCIADSLGYYGQNFTEDYHFGGTVDGAVFTDIQGDNAFYNNRNPGVYWNGDGIASEHGLTNAVMNNVRAHGNDDAGIDLKAENLTINGGLLKGNKKNGKFWGNTGGTINDLRSVNPVRNGGTDATQHYLFAGGTAATVWNINRPVIRNDLGNTSTIFRAENPAGAINVNVNDWQQTKTATTFSITGTDTLNDGGNGLAAILAEAPLWLTGCANAANNNVPLYVTASSAGSLTLARMDGTPAALTNEAAGATITLHWGIIVDPGTVITSASVVGLNLTWNPALPTLSLALNYRAGFTSGRVASGTPAGTTIADLVATGTAAGLTYQLTADLHGAFVLVGTELRLLNTLNADVFPFHTFALRAYDITGLAVSAVTGSFFVDTPHVNFSCDWEGANNATTAVDDGAGATLSFIGGAKLTTAAPLAGSASLLVGGGSQRVNVPDVASWQFTDAFSLKAKINLTSIPVVAGIITQWLSSGSQLSFFFGVTTAGALELIYSGNGSGTATIKSADGVISINQTYEIAADRDIAGNVRLYLNGAMVAKVNTTTSFFNSSSPLSIGNGAGGSNGAVGKIDGTRIYKGWAFCASDAGYTVV